MTQQTLGSAENWGVQRGKINSNATDAETRLALAESKALNTVAVKNGSITRAIKYLDANDNVIMVDIYADAAVTDYADKAVVGTIQWAIEQLSLGGIIVMSSGTFPTLSVIQIRRNIIITGYGGATLIDTGHNGNCIELSNGDIWTASTVVSAGDYAITATANPNGTRFKCTTGGTTGSTEPSWNHTIGGTTADGTVVWEAEEVTRWGLGSFKIALPGTSAGDGISGESGIMHGFFRDLTFSGGGPTSWCIDLDAATIIDMQNIEGDIDCNGIRWTLNNPTVFPYNFGDSQMQMIDLNLRGDNAIGMQFIGSKTNINVNNNIKIDRFEFTGLGTVDSAQIGVWIENCSRLTFDHGDIETINYGVVELSSTGSGSQTSAANSFQRIHFIPAGAQTEAVGYMRGAPLQAQHNTGTATFVIRSAWVDWLEFSNGDSLGVAMDDFGRYNRIISSIAADTPSAGLSTITMTANMNTTMPLDRVPFLTKGASFPVRTSFWGSDALGQGIMVPGPNPMVSFLPSSTSDSVTWESMHLKLQDRGVIDILRDRTGSKNSPSPGSIRFDLNGGGSELGNTGKIYPAVAGEVLRIGDSGKQTVRYSETVAKSSAYTATQTDEIILVSASSPWTLALPPAADSEGKRYTIKKTDNNANVITIDGDGSETIDGAATYTGLNAQNKYVFLVCDGSGWFIVGEG